MRRLVLLLALTASPTLAQSAPKDAGVATLVGFLFPGGGQYYSEATGKGLLYTALVGASVVVGMTRSHDARYSITLRGTTLQNAYWDSTLVEHANRTPLKVGAAIGGIVWFLAALDAPNDAKRANQKRARVTVISDPKRIGLAVAF